MNVWWVNNSNQKYDMSDRLIKIDGADMICDINTSSIAGYNGSTLVSKNMPERTIILLFDVYGDLDKERQNMPVYFGENGTLYIQCNGNTRKIYGVVKEISYPIEQHQNQYQVSLLCSSPFFTDLEPNIQVMSALKPLFRFPHHFDGPFKFSERDASVSSYFENKSTVDVYPIIEMKAITALTNPSIINLTDPDNYKTMKVNVSMSAGDILRIDTRIGQKTITKNGINVFNSKDCDFEFFKLKTGKNLLKYDADTNSGGLQTTVIWDNLYGGV